ncbi:MAG: nicotinic acid mononucleotide adenylyltransferase [Legionella sp.]|nr:MAG: nicotinic acid mononucleotide adenylyltransferase [Legionella sp.]PJD99226.1 MAG: nicotinic acid mononucleotide adenylyltransferase [Legionella sp.]
MHSIAVYGGTFDPIHYGHIQTSRTIQGLFQFDTYLFLPCKLPTLKAPAKASNQQRITMLQLALKKDPQFSIDLREVKRSTPSYMVETLQSFREEFKNSAITLILGRDAFYSLPCWHQWEKIITLAHLLVIERNTPNIKPSREIKNLLKHYEVNEHGILTKKPFGAIFQIKAGDYPVSSTQIRELIKQENAPDGINKNHLHTLTTQQLPEEVYHYIMQQGLYQ